MESCLAFLARYIFTPAMPAMIFAFGLFFLLILRGKPLTKPIFMIKTLVSGGKSSLKSLCLALAGTLGVGNIVGVASAIAIGGAGAIFWMMVSSVFAMVLKYAEIVLAMLHRKEIGGTFRGGPMYYIKSKRIAKIFAGICAIVSVPLGSLIQVKAASDSISFAFSLPPIAVGLLFCALSAFVIFGGAKRVTEFTFKLIPPLTVLYLAMSLIVILANIKIIPAVFAEIFASAFESRSAFGGIAGILLSDSLRIGVSRGIMSNEAGCGSAPIAHAHAQVKYGAEQGIWGVFEVFCDTVLLCPLTALAILCTKCVNRGDMTDVSSAYMSVIGPFAPPLIATSITLFAFATVICWAHYGEEAILYLSEKKLPILIYRLFYVICIPLGAILDSSVIWDISDILLSVMTVINCTTIVIHSKEIIKESKKYFTKDQPRTRASL